jgi:hypothetical protein
VAIPGEGGLLYTDLLVDRGGRECPHRAARGGAGKQQVPRFARNDKFSGWVGAALGVTNLGGRNQCWSRRRR